VLGILEQLRNDTAPDAACRPRHKDFLGEAIRAGVVAQEKPDVDVPHAATASATAATARNITATFFVQMVV